MRSALNRINRRSALLALLAVCLLTGVALGSGAGQAPTPKRSQGGSPRVAIESGSAAPAVAERGTRGKRGRRGKRGPRGPRGRSGPQGERGERGERGATGPAGSSDERVIDVGVDWNDTVLAPGHEDASTPIPGIGTLRIECPASSPDNPSVRRLVLTPSNRVSEKRTVATLTTFQGAGTNAAANRRYETDDATSALVVQLPKTGVISGTFSVEPRTGGSADAGGLPVADLTLSSYWNANDPNGSFNFCHVSAQILAKGQ